MISELGPKQRTQGQAFIMLREKITKEAIFEEAVIPSSNLRCQRKQKSNNAKIIYLGISIVALDKLASLGSHDYL